MISLFYKLRLLSYVLNSFKDIIAKLFLLIMYFYASSIMLMFLTNGFWYAVEFSSFKNAFYHLFQYCKWYYENREDLGYGIFIRILVAFLTPHFLYKLFLSTGWKSLLKKKVIQILKLIITRRKKGNEFSNNSKPSNNNNEHYVQDTEQKVDMIKQILLNDIEKAIDKRLHDIFLDKRDKPH